jgi:DNA-binding MarR family transcriptional regulator
MLLEYLAQHDGSSQRDLATSLCVEAPTITRMVQRLEQGTLIERRPDPDDARVTRLYLTDAGRAVQQEIYAVWERVEAVTLADFSEEESASLRRLLKKAQHNLTIP